MKENKSSVTNKHNVIIVGAGAAGLGVAVVLQQLGIEYIVVENPACCKLTPQLRPDTPPPIIAMFIFMNTQKITGLLNL